MASIDAAIRDPAVLGDNTLTVANAIDETGLSASLHVFGRRGRRCGILLSGDFVDVGGSRQTTRVGGLTTPNLETTADLELRLVEAAGLLGTRGDGTGWMLMAGIRLVDATTGFEAHHSGSADVWGHDAGATVVDALLGLVYRDRFSDRWELDLRADAAAGGTDLIFNAALGVGYRLDAAGRCTLTVGYRYLATKIVVEDREAEVAFEPQLDGFLLGLTIRS